MATIYSYYIWLLYIATFIWIVHDEYFSSRWIIFHPDGSNFSSISIVHAWKEYMHGVNTCMEGRHAWERHISIIHIDHPYRSSIIQIDHPSSRWIDHAYTASIHAPDGQETNHFGIILASFWDHFGIILASFWDHSGFILGSFWGHFRIILGSFWASFWHHFGIIWPSFGHHLGIILA